jgi:hypothetical protein
MRLAMVLATMIVSTPGVTHDFWINNGGYKDPNSGIHCCGPSDCHVLNPDRIVAKQDGYHLLDFGNEVVPYSEAYPSEDRDYWRCQKTDGSRRCFFAPTGAS